MSVVLYLPRPSSRQASSGCIPRVSLGDPPHLPRAKVAKDGWDVGLNIHVPDRACLTWRGSLAVLAYGNRVVCVYDRI